MKKTIIILLIVFVSFTIKAQIVNIPDANFKYALVNYNVADLGNGYNEDVDTNNDSEIQLTEAEAVIGLYIGEMNINTIEGIQYFINIEILNCSQNYLIPNLPITSMHSLRELECSSNQIANIDVTQNPLLEFLSCGSNLLTNLDITQNINLLELYISGEQLSSLDVTQNPLLKKLICNNNQLTSLNVTQNVNLENVHLEFNSIQSLDLSYNINLNFFVCAYNQLTDLNIQNGHNTSLTVLFAESNPDLTCIQVDDVVYANAQTSWHKDATVVYSEDCNIGVNESEIDSNISLYPNPFKGILYITNKGSIELGRITVYDILGNTILIENNNFSQLNLSILKSGVLFVKIETKVGTITKKIIKI